LLRVPRSSVFIGLVSDTHGLFDPKLDSLLAGADLILHAGDICRAAVLQQLVKLAPVRAIYGNCDVPPLSQKLPAWRLEQVRGSCVLVLHDLGKPAKPRPPAKALIEQFRPEVVVSGHSHQAALEAVQGTLFVNPGSAGPKRFKLVRSAATLLFSEAAIVARVYSLETHAPVQIAQLRFRRTEPGRFTGSAALPLYRSDPIATMGADPLRRKARTAGAGKRMASINRSRRGAPRVPAAHPISPTGDR